MTHTEQRRNIAVNARSVMMAAHVILALGTAVVGWQLMTGWDTIAQILPPFYHKLAAIGAGFGLYFLLDRKVLVFLPYAVSVVLRLFGHRAKGFELDQSTGFMKFFDWMAVIVAAIMITGSVYMNFVVSPEIGAMAAPGADTGAFSNIVAGNNSTYERQLAAFESAAQKAEQKVQDAQNAKTEAIAAAQKSRGGEMARLAAGGNDWAVSQIRGAVASAERKADRRIETAQKAAQKAQDALTAFISKAGGKVAATNAKVTDKLTAAVDETNSRRGRYVMVMYFVMAAAGLSFVIGCIMVQIYEGETGDHLSPEVTTGKVLGAFQAKAGQGALSTLARGLGVADRVKFGHGSPSVRIQPNGTIALDARQGATLFPVSPRAAQAWRQESNKQTEQYRAERGQNTETQNFGHRNTEKTETQNRTTQNGTEIEKLAEQGSGVGVGQYPDPDDNDQMKAFVKRFRARSSYSGASDAKVQEQAAWLRANGYTAQIKGGNNWIITKGGKVQNGTVENEYEWDVFSSNENAEA